MNAQVVLARLVNGFWLMVVGLLILLAVYVAAGRELWPRIDVFRADIEQALSEQLKLSVRIGSVQGQWEGFDPILRLETVQIDGTTPEQKGLQLDAAEIRLDMLGSLLQLSPRFSQFDLAGVELEVTQSEQGQWRLTGLPQPAAQPRSSASGSNAVLTWFRRASVSLTDITIVTQSSKQFAERWQLPNVVLAYEGDSYAASGRLLQPGKDDHFLTFAVRGRGNPLAGSFSGEAWADWVSGPFLDGLLDTYDAQGLFVAHLDARGELWTTWHQGRLMEAVGKLNVDEMQWRNQHRSVAPLLNLSGGFAWLRNTDRAGWDLLLDGVQFSWLNQLWPISQYHVRQTQAATGEGSDLTVMAEWLDLGMLSRLLLAADFGGPEVEKQLTGFYPEGLVHRAEVKLPAKGTADYQVEVRAEVQEVNTQAFKGSPAVRGVNGYVYANERFGALQAHSDNFFLHFPKLFDQGWWFSHASGPIRWRIDQGDYSVGSEAVSLELDQGAKVAGAFEYRNDGKDLGLAIAIDNAPATIASRFLPTTMPERTRDWMGESILGGTIRRGLFLYNGTTETGQPDYHVASRMAFDIEGGHLAYSEKWPELTQFSGLLQVDSSDVNVTVRSGEAGGMQISGGRAWLNDDIKIDDKTTLALDLTATGDADAAQAWLAFHPTAQEAVNRQLNVSGQFDLHVDARIAVRDLPLSRFDINADLLGLDLYLQASDMRLTDIRGGVHYSSREGVKAKQLSAHLFGEPLTLSAAPLSKDNPNATRIRLDGQLDLSQMFEWQSVTPPAFVSGHTTFSGEVDLTPVDGGLRTDIRLASDLRGVDLRMPEPFSKPTNQAWDLSFKRLQTATGHDHHLVFGPYLRGRWHVSDDDHLRGRLAITGRNQVPDLPERPGMQVDIQLPSVDGKAWSEFSRLAQNDEESDPRWAQDNVNTINVALDELRFGDMAFNSVRATGDNQADGWQVALSSDRLQGQLNIPHAADAKTQVDLAHLRLPRAADTDETELPAEEKPPIDPTTFPDVVLTIERLYYGEEDYGTWALETSVRDDALVVRDLSGNIKRATIQGGLTWFKPQNNDRGSVILRAKVETGDIEKMLAEWDFVATTTTEKVDLDTTLVWNGGPQDFSLLDASGEMTLRMTKGRFKELNNPGTGAIRVLGVFNFAAVARRLRLDFRDIYKSGLSFDVIEGRAQLDNGIVSIADSLRIEGPSGNFVLRGTANLHTKELDQEMTVNLPATTNLPLAALIVGAPPIGGAVYLLDKLLGEPLSQISTATYKINGPWDAPEVTFDRVLQREPKKKKREAEATETAKANAAKGEAEQGVNATASGAGQ